MSESTRYTCQVCKREFKHAGHRNRHEQQVHNGIGEFKCKDCGSVFKRWENLNRHRQTHGGTHTSFKCVICQKTFGRGDSLAQHQRQVHGGERYNCTYCKASFTRKFNLDKHLKKHPESKGDKPNQDLQEKCMGHRSVSGYAQDYDQDAGPSTSKQSDKGQQQRKRKAYTSPSALNSTDSSYTGPTSKGKVECKACSWKGKSLRAHLSQTTKSCKNMHDDQALRCDAKNKHEEQKAVWESHHKEDRNQRKKERRGIPNDHCSTKRREVQEPKEDLQCNICERQFSRKEYLDRHTYNVHLKQSKFTCQYCKKTYCTKSNLERHISASHQNHPAKVWPCQQCPEYFFRKDVLDKHMQRGKHSFYVYCKYCDKNILFKSVKMQYSHFVMDRTLTWLDRLRGFSKDTCINKLKKEKEQLEEFKRGTTTCIHCNEVVYNRNSKHWIYLDLEAPFKGTCINNLMMRPHIKCWMCKEKLFPKPENQEKSLSLFSPGISDKWFHQDVFTNHFRNVFDTFSCISDQKSSWTYHKKKVEHLREMREPRKMEIVNKIPEGKKMWEIEYHILYCNSDS